MAIPYTYRVAKGSPLTNEEMDSNLELTEQAFDQISTMRSEAVEARDAALIAGTIYESPAAGLAATSEGAYFSTPSVELSEHLVLYRHEGGLAVVKKVYPSAAGILSPSWGSITGTLANQTDLQEALDALTPDVWEDTQTAVNKTLSHMERCRPTVSGLTLTLPPKAAGLQCAVVSGGFEDTVIGRNNATIGNLPDDRVLNAMNREVEFSCDGSDWSY